MKPLNGEMAGWRTRVMISALGGSEKTKSPARVVILRAVLALCPSQPSSSGIQFFDFLSVLGLEGLPLQHHTLRCSTISGLAKKGREIPWNFGELWNRHNALPGKALKNRRKQKKLPPPIHNFVCSIFPCGSYSFTKVTAPSEAEETSAAYLEKTPRL